MATKAQRILREAFDIYTIGLTGFGIFAIVQRGLGVRTDDEKELAKKNPSYNKFHYDVHRTFGWPHYLYKMAKKIYE
jgi:hypothetical protein